MDFSYISVNYPMFWSYAVIPILICLARITDVTIGSLRIVFLSKGLRIIAPILGFFEVVIWLIAISQVMKHMDNWVNYIAYGLGFALGNYFGIVLEEKLSIGNVMLRVITKNEALELIDHFQKAGLRVTYVDASGLKGPVQILFTIIRRKQLNSLIQIIQQYNPEAVYSVEDIRQVSAFAINDNVSKSFGVRKRGFHLRRKGK